MQSCRNLHYADFYTRLYKEMQSEFSMTDPQINSVLWIPRFVQYIHPTNDG